MTRTFDAQRERDTKLLFAFVLQLRGREANFAERIVMQRVLDNDAATPYILNRVTNELVPALELLRNSRYNLGPVPLRGLAGRLDTAVKLIDGDPV